MMYRAITKDEIKIGRKVSAVDKYQDIWLFDGIISDIEDDKSTLYLTRYNDKKEIVTTDWICRYIGGENFFSCDGASRRGYLAIEQISSWKEELQ